MHVYYISLQKHFTPFNNPELPVLLHTLRTRFPEDDQLTVIPLSGANSGYFKIIVSDPPPNEEFSLPMMVEGASVNLPLLSETDFNNLRGKHSGGQQWAEGKLVTLYNSHVGPLSTYTNQQYDEFLAEVGEITRPTQLQYHSGTSGPKVLNGNRYCVLKPKNDIPDRLAIPDPTKPGKYIHVTLGYKGKEKFCARCMNRHPGTCAELLDFYRARDKRKEQVIIQKLLSDSTLRHADETGLSSDIMCMSGGRIGNVSHVIQDDKTMAAVTQVIVVAGQNDLLRDNETLADFKAIAGKSLELLQHFGSKKNLSIVQPLMPKGISQLQKDKADFLDELCSQKSALPHNPIMYINNLPDIEMSGIHPTIDGTAQLLRWIDKRVKIITDGRFITDKKMYRGSRSLYKYGCLLCPKYLHLDDYYFCPDCGTEHYPPSGKGDFPAHGDTTPQRPGSVHVTSSSPDVVEVIMTPEKGLGKRPLSEDTSLDLSKKSNSQSNTNGNDDDFEVTY